MSPLEILRATFSRYELAYMGQLLTYALLLGAFVLLGMGYMGGMLILVLACVILIAFLVLSECPTCGKSPTAYYPIGEGGWLGRFAWGRRFWPERVCSSCGTRLDGI